MKPTSLSEDREFHAKLNELFHKAPILVEVRFPQMGTSPDWYLCEDEEGFESVLARLGKGAELHLSSVWDLKPTSAGVVLHK